MPRGHKETNFIRFSRREKTARGTWSMTLSLTTLADSVPAPSIQQHRHALEQIWHQAGSSLNFPLGYPHPRKRSNFGKLSRFAPLPARVVTPPTEPAEPSRSTSDDWKALFPERDRPVYWPGDKPPRESRSKRRRRKGLRRKDWVWMAVAATLALLFSFLLYISLPKAVRNGAGPQSSEHTNSPVGAGQIK